MFLCIVLPMCCPHCTLRWPTGQTPRPHRIPCLPMPPGRGAPLTPAPASTTLSHAPPRTGAALSITMDAAFRPGSFPVCGTRCRRWHWRGLGPSGCDDGRLREGKHVKQALLYNLYTRPDAHSPRHTACLPSTGRLIHSCTGVPVCVQQLVASARGATWGNLHQAPQLYISPAASYGTPTRCSSTVWHTRLRFMRVQNN